MSGGLYDRGKPLDRLGLLQSLKMREYPFRNPGGHVAPFEQSDDGGCWKPLPHPPRQLGIMRWLEGKTSQRIAGHGIESCRDQQQRRRPVRGCRHDGGPQVSNVQPRLFTRASRHIEDVPYPTFARGAGPWIPGMLVKGDIPDRGVGLDQRLCAVTVMDVPVDDEHLPPAGPLRVPGRYYRMIHEAETHPSGCQGVMSRRTYRGKGMRPILDGVINGLQYRTRRPQHSGPALAIQDGIQKQNTATTGTHRLQGAEVLIRMDGEQRVTSRNRGLVDGDTRFAMKPIKYRL